MKHSKLKSPTCAREFEDALDRAIYQDDTEAMFQVASYYEHNRTMASHPNSFPRAMVWYQRAADRDHPEACLRVGKEHDWAGKKETALQYFDRGALHGSSECKNLALAVRASLNAQDSQIKATAKSNSSVER